PGDRYASAADLAEDLRRWREDRPIRARRIGVLGRLVRWARRNPAVAGLTGAGFGLLILLLGSSWLAVGVVGQERDRVKDERGQAVAAREETRRALMVSLYNQARIELATGRPGRRWRALDLIRQTVGRREPSDAAGVPSPVDLRGAAAEA